MKRKNRNFFLLKKVDIRVGTVIGIFGGVLAICLAFFLFWFTFVGIIHSSQPDFISDIIDNQITKAYEGVADNWQESEFVESLSYICSFQSTELKKVKCVHHYIKDIANKANHGFGNQLRKSPEKIIEFGGLCRDYSCLYASLMKRFNISYEFAHLPGHSYLKVYPDDYTCVLDIKELECVENEKRIS